MAFSLTCEVSSRAAGERRITIFKDGQMKRNLFVRTKEDGAAQVREYLDTLAGVGLPMSGAESEALLLQLNTIWR